MVGFNPVVRVLVGDVEGCTSAEQRRVAEEMIRDVDASGHWPGKTVTKISESLVFWEMGPEDQDYFLRFPHGCKPPFPRKSDKSEDHPAFASPSTAV